MKKILILEDELMIGALYKRRLNLAGFGVQHAKDPDEMFKILNDFKPEVFLLDHGILGHEKTGTECIPKIRKKFPKSKIYTLSNYSKKDLKNKFPNKIFEPDEYLLKMDYSPNKIMELLK